MLNIFLTHLGHNQIYCCKKPPCVSRLICLFLYNGNFGTPRMWTWKESDRFPPIEHVFGSPIWQMKEYESLREKLSTPVPTATVFFSDAGFATIDTLKSESGNSSPTSTGRFASPFFRVRAPLHFRAGLVHLCLGCPGIPLPNELSVIKYNLIFVEAGPNATGVHAIALKSLVSSRGFSLTLCGAKMDRAGPVTPTAARCRCSSRSTAIA